MNFPADNYAPPGVYTRTLFENPIAQVLSSLRIPVFIGEGNESLFQRDLEIVRGSSSSVDTRVPLEDMTGRSVVSILASGQVTVGDFDGVRTKIQVRNFPIVTSDGTGTPTTNRSDVQVVTTNNEPLVVLSVDGVRGIIELAQPPVPGQEVRCSYFFDRTDTLTTDDVSDQVTAESARVLAISGIADVNSPNPSTPPAVLKFNGDITNVLGEVIVPANNVLLVRVDGVNRTVIIPSTNTGFTVSQVASAITGAAAGTLTAGTYINQYGHSALYLSAASDILVGNGSANAVLGLVEGQSSARAMTFYTFNGPIVDGSNGGVTTTDPAAVVVKVDGTQVIPTRVDGASRAVTLGFAPKPGAKVTIRYYFNTWQNTFDYLANINVTSILQAGFTPGGSDFIQGADFVLKDDRIHWGTAALVSAGTNTAGTELFDDTQVSPFLIDNKTYLSACAPVIDASTGVASKVTFTLSDQPTLGNGRSTTLGQSLFQDVANGRIDVPVNRPDVIEAYWGYDVQDALVRGRQTVTKVDGLNITLASPVPVGATVFASFYYNRLVDMEYTITNTLSGASGAGKYTAKDSGGNDILNVNFNPGTKGASLNGVTIEFPSGSELSPDARLEGGSGNQFIGPVEEVVTVQFATRWAGPARYSSPGSALFQFIPDQSDRLRLEIDGAGLVASSAGLDLQYSGGAAPVSYGVFASLLGEEIEYTGGSGATPGLTYNLDTTEELSLLVDNSEVEVRVAPQSNVNASVFVSAINEAAGGHTSTAAAGAAAATEIVLNAAVRSSIPDYYKNWVVVMGNGATATGVSTVTAYNGATGVATLSPALSITPVAGDAYHIYNPAARSFLKGATRFTGPIDIVAGAHDTLRFVFVDAPTGSTGTLTATIAPGTYASAADLATAVNTAIGTAVTTFVGGNAAYIGLEITCTADGDGRLQFAIQLPGIATAGSLEFLNGASPSVDFAITAGLSTGATTGGGQAALIQAPIASLYTVTTGGVKPYDRIILRNRIMPGGGPASSIDPSWFEEQTGLLVRGGSAQTKTGLNQLAFGTATAHATVRPASVAGFPSFNGGFSGVSGELQVTFYDGTGLAPANNIFQFTLDGVPVTVTFTASSTGTVTPLGPLTTASTVLDQIVDAIAAVPGAPFGNAAAVLAAGLVRQEGLGIRLTSSLANEQSLVVIGTGSANTALGFAEGTTALRKLVTVEQLAAFLMGQRNSAFSALLLGFTASATYFANHALAGVVQDAALAKYLYVQTRTVGAGSQIRFRFTDVAGVQTEDALFTGTALSIPDNGGSLGEAALNGFFVTSGTANGSGSANDSILNPAGTGIGQDGVIGQTYRDKVTGLTFTILPRGWQTNQVGPWVSYPTGATATFRFEVSKTMTADANLPVRAFPGLEVRVSNTLNIGLGDTAILSTFERGGEEPKVGDLYYVSYVFQKRDFSTGFFTKMSAIETAFGSISPDNPVSLASFLAILNGAVLLGIKQVQKAEGSQQGSLSSYVAAIEELEGVQPGQVAPDVITPLRGDSLELFQILKRSNDIQSSLRYRQERTSIIGLSAGSLPARAQQVAQQLRSTRMRLVYPDIAILEITDAFGNVKEYLVDGTYIAAALVGSTVSPNYDVASPWTNRLLVGFVALARAMDAVEMNQTAVKGVTIVEQRGTLLRVRHELTTDMTNQLTKLPTIILIADEVQKQARATLARFIGLKYLPTVVSQVEGRMAMMFRRLVEAQIVAAYTGIKATPDREDQTLLNLEAFYSPVFPLLYILITFHLRSRLTA